MEFSPPYKTIWAKAKRYSPLLIVGTIIEETLRHRLFASINDELDRRAGPMIHHFIDWLFGDPVRFYVLLVATYCIIVIVGSQISYLRSKKLKLKVIELRSELDDIVKSRRPAHIESLWLAIDELYKWHDRATRIINRLFGQDEAKKLIYIKDAYNNRLNDDIKSFYDETKQYNEYLTCLLGDIEKHPELWI